MVVVVVVVVVSGRGRKCLCPFVYNDFIFLLYCVQADDQDSDSEDEAVMMSPPALTQSDKPAFDNDTGATPLQVDKLPQSQQESDKTPMDVDDDS